MKKGFILASLIVAASMVFMSFKSSAPTYRKQCISSFDQPMVIGSWWYSTNEEALEAARNNALMFGLNHSNVTTQTFPNVPGGTMYGYVICGDPMFYED